MILALILACSGPRSAAELPSADPVVAETPPAADADITPVAGAAPATGADITAVEGGQAPVPAPRVTPGAAYAGCRDRVELPEAAGECVTDADCSTAGCSQEVCVAAVNAADVMTTCEVLPCFAALDTCGCVEGMCSWSLKSEMPPLGRLPLPPKNP